MTSLRRTWLVTGGAGFIGSHLVESSSARAAGPVLDNFATGTGATWEAARGHEHPWSPRGRHPRPRRLSRACAASDVILHQAALGSVPRSIEDPLATHAANVTGFLNVLQAARERGVRRVVYASSSSVYGDHPGLPKVEELVGRQLSPYAVSKYANELYAHAFGLAYGMELLGLRYFNVFGPRQDPKAPTRP